MISIRVWYDIGHEDDPDMVVLETLPLLPYLPRIGDILDFDGCRYKVTEVEFSFGVDEGKEPEFIDIFVED